MMSPIRISALTTVIVLAVAAVAGAAIAAGVPDLTGPTPAARTLPAGLTGSFAFLTRTPVPADAVPSGLGVVAYRGVGVGYAVGADRSRRVVAPNGAQMGFLPGATGSCLELANGAGVCAPNTGPDGAETRGLWLMLRPVSGTAAATVEGVLPAHAHATLALPSTASAVPTGAEGAFAVGDPSGVTLTIHEPDGGTFAATP
jgi:hypothetical protein